MTDHSRTNVNSVLTKSQDILELNEDLIAAIVENMQIGNLENCLELDNYPPGDEDLYNLPQFPDKLMRKDILNDFRPAGSYSLPNPPLAPACKVCVSKNISPSQCRQEFGHVDPSSKFSRNELHEFLCATEVLALNHRNFLMDKISGKRKRVYRRWNDNERYTLMVAISLVGSKDTTKIASLMRDRTPNQIRNFILKNFSESEIFDWESGKLPPPPLSYQPPSPIAHLFADPSHLMSHNHTNQSSGSQAAVTQKELKITPTRFGKYVKTKSDLTSAIEPFSGSGYGGWNTLLSIATDTPQDFSSLPIDTSNLEIVSMATKQQSFNSSLVLSVDSSQSPNSPPLNHNNSHDKDHSQVQTSKSAPTAEVLDLPFGALYTISARKESKIPQSTMSLQTGESNGYDSHSDSKAKGTENPFHEIFYKNRRNSVSTEDKKSNSVTEFKPTTVKIKTERSSHEFFPFVPTSCSSNIFHSPQLSSSPSQSTGDNVDVIVPEYSLSSLGEAYLDVFVFGNDNVEEGIHPARPPSAQVPSNAFRRKAKNMTPHVSKVGNETNEKSNVIKKSRSKNNSTKSKQQNASSSARGSPVNSEKIQTDRNTPTATNYILSEESIAPYISLPEHVLDDSLIDAKKLVQRVDGMKPSSESVAINDDYHDSLMNEDSILGTLKFG